MKKIIPLFLIAILFVSCASTKIEKTPALNKVYVTNTTKVDLLPVNAIKEPVEIYQQFTGTFGEKHYTASLYLQADDQGITILILNEMGIEIGSIVYDGKSCTMDSSFFPPQLKPEYIILDLQNAFCDKKMLVEHYKKYGLTYTGDGVVPCARRDGFRGHINTIEKDGQVIEQIKVSYSYQYVLIENKLRNYKYSLCGSEDIEGEFID